MATGGQELDQLTDGPTEPTLSPLSKQDERPPLHSRDDQRGTPTGCGRGRERGSPRVPGSPQVPGVGNVGGNSSILPGDVCGTPPLAPGGRTNTATDSATLGSNRAPPVVHVHVRAPVLPPRLGVFTGVKPSGGAEENFKDWKDKVSQYFEEEKEDVRFPRIRGSLKGLAKEQTKACSTSDSLIQALTDIYDSTQTAEDLYLEFVQLQISKGETPADFLSRLWKKFCDVNRDEQYSSKEVNKKVYHVFSTQVKSRHPMLALELRNNNNNK